MYIHSRISHIHKLLSSAPNSLLSAATNHLIVLL